MAKSTGRMGVKVEKGCSYGRISRKGSHTVPERFAPPKVSDDRLRGATALTLWDGSIQLWHVDRTAQWAVKGNTGRAL